MRADDVLCLVASVFGLLGLALLFCLIFLGAAALESADCRAQWVDSGMDVRYRVIGGCQVRQGGRWLPAKSVRAQP